MSQMTSRWKFQSKMANKTHIISIHLNGTYIYICIACDGVSGNAIYYAPAKIRCANRVVNNKRENLSIQSHSLAPAMLCLYSWEIFITLPTRLE